MRSKKWAESLGRSPAFGSLTEGTEKETRDLCAKKCTRASGQTATLFRQLRMFYKLLKPVLFRLDAERAHEIVTGMLRAAANTPLAIPILRAAYAYDDPI